jgi:hypothetical protein
MNTLIKTLLYFLMCFATGSLLAQGIVNVKIKKTTMILQGSWEVEEVNYMEKGKTNFYVNAFNLDYHFSAAGNFTITEKGKDMNSGTYKIRHENSLFLNYRRSTNNLLYYLVVPDSSSIKMREDSVLIISATTKDGLRNDYLRKIK